MIKIKIDPQKKLSRKEFDSAIENPSNRISGKDYLLSQIKALEDAYGMNSKTFYCQYVQGQLPDHFDYLKWAHLWKAYNHLCAPGNKGGNG